MKEHMPELDTLPVDAIVLGTASADLISKGTCSVKLKGSTKIKAQKFILVENGKALGIVQLGKHRVISTGRGNKVDKGQLCSVVTVFDKPLATNVSPDAIGVIKNVAVRVSAKAAAAAARDTKRAGDNGEQADAGVERLPSTMDGSLPVDVIAKKSSYTLTSDDVKTIAIAALSKIDSIDAADLAGEGGVHVHALDRVNKTAIEEGSHQHIFMVDGEPVATSFDGDHSHELTETISDVAEAGASAHTHKLILPDGTEVTTSDDGEHMHTLQVSKTGLDGLHQHEIHVGDQTLMSLTPGQFFGLFGDTVQDDTEKRVHRKKPKKGQTGIAEKFAALRPAVEGLKFAAPGLTLLDTVGDTIDVMVHGPVSAPMRRAIEEELAKRLPAATSTRLRLVTDELGAPAVASIPLARLAIEFAESPSLVDAPTLAKGLHVQPRGAQRAAIHYDFADTGDFVLKVHLQADENLITWSLDASRMSNLHEVVKSVDDAGVVCKAASLDGSRYQRPLRGSSVTAEPSVDNSQVMLDHQGKVYGMTKGVTAVIDKPSVEYGLQLDGYHEYFLSGTGVFKGVLVCSAKPTCSGIGWESSVQKSNLPTVLTAVAVEREIMPPLGVSGLPESLEKEVPSELQYWRAKTAKDARSIRDALVHAQYLTDTTVKIVNGNFRRVGQTVQHHIAKNLPATVAIGAPPPSVPQAIDPVRKVALMLPNDGSDVVLFDRSLAKSMSPQEVADKAADLVDEDFLIAYPDSPGARYDLSKCGRLFKLAGHSGTLFVTSAYFDAGTGIEWLANPAKLLTDVSSERVDSLVKRLGNQKVRIVKGIEERFVFGIVLEPETVDAQDDIYSADEVRKAAHVYLEEFGHIKLMHEGAPIDSQVKILESYIAPVDFELDGQAVKKGTWLLAVRVLEDDLWTAVKRGELDGFSIGGTARRDPK